MKGIQKASWRKFFAALILMTPVLALVGCGSSSSSGTGTGTVSGVITDSSGDPIGGATVVAGTSSPTAITDKDGNFTISGVPSGTVTINAITPGYNTNNFTVIVSDNTTTTISHPIHLPDVDDFGNAPVITNASAPFNSNAFAVTATINPTTNCLFTCSIADARAELVGYGVGTVLSKIGSTYTGSITLPASFTGPSAIIKIFAIDNTGRIGVKVLVVSVPTASGSGNFNVAALNGSWGGNSTYHHASFGNGDLLGDKRIANVNLSVSGSNVTGKFAAINIESFIPTSGWGVTTTSFSGGTASLIDASLGLYQVTSTFNPSSSRTINLNMIGKLDSATTPSNFVGYFEATIIDTGTSVGTVTTDLMGHFTLLKNLTWTYSDLTGNWVWSEFVKSSTINATYKNPYQYNSAITLDGTGAVTSGKDTMGYTLTNSINFTMIDASVGYFGGTVSSSDSAGSTIAFVGLLGPAKLHTTGLFTISSGGSHAYGPFWGSNIATPPHYSSADLAELRHDGILIDSIWRGFYVVSGGSSGHTGSICYLSLWVNSSGTVVRGKIATIHNSCPSVTRFTNGSFSFSDTTDGQVSGNANDGITTFTLAPASARNASMGVYKERLVGDFSVNSGTDTGFFFLARTLIEQ